MGVHLYFDLSCMMGSHSWSYTYDTYIRGWAPIKCTHNTRRYDTTRTYQTHTTSTKCVRHTKSHNDAQHSIRLHEMDARFGCDVCDSLCTTHSTHTIDAHYALELHAQHAYSTKCTEKKYPLCGWFLAHIAPISRISFRSPANWPKKIPPMRIIFHLISPILAGFRDGWIKIHLEIQFSDRLEVF